MNNRESHSILHQQIKEIAPDKIATTQGREIVAGIIKRRFGDLILESDLEDFVQVAWIRLINKMKKHLKRVPTKKFRSWVIELVYHSVIDGLRVRYPKKPDGREITMVDYASLETEPADEGDLQSWENLHDLARDWANLSPEEQEVTKLRLAGYSAKEIAAATGSITSTTRNRLLRARKKLNKFNNSINS